MTAQTAARHPAAPQTPPLPQAKPESLGLSAGRLARMSDAFKRDIDKGTTPGVTMMVARHGQIGWFDALGRQNPASPAPMAHNTLFRIFSMTKPIVSVGIMMLLEEGTFLLQPSHCEIHSGISGTEGRRRKQWQARTRTAQAADHDPGPVAAYLRHRLREHTRATAWCSKQLYQQSRVRSRKISNAEHAPRWSRACRCCASPAPNGTTAVPRHRPPHRGRLRQNPGRLPDRAHPRADAVGRDRVSHRA